LSFGTDIAFNERGIKKALKRYSNSSRKEEARPIDLTG
jgi:hypothetical protein